MVTVGIRVFYYGYYDDVTLPWFYDKGTAMLLLW